MKNIKQLDMELYGGCNYDCDMCPQKDKGRERNFRVMLPYDTFTKIVDDAILHGVETISLHGSGEPTMCPYLVDAVKYIKNKSSDIRVFVFTNGYTLTPEKSRMLIEAGLDVLRISIIGHTREEYTKWMGKAAYDKLQYHAKAFSNILKELNSTTELHTYHLITDQSEQEKQILGYRNNWINYVGSQSEIWLMHNWAGTYEETPYHRDEISKTMHSTIEQRSCGRMFQPMLQVRAGGLEKGQHGAVVACCMVLGRDSEAVLGHLDTQTIEEVLNDAPLKELQDAHLQKKWDTISYCKGCDQLYDVPESLVWTNIPGREYKQSKMIDSLRIEISEEHK